MPLQQSQRVQVELQPDHDEKRVKIRIESFDEHLGWYTAGSLQLALCQLPLLEQAVVEMRKLQPEHQDPVEEKIIPFPV